MGHSFAWPPAPSWEEEDETTPSHAAESPVEADETLEESVKVALHSISVVPPELSYFELLYRKERVVVEMEKLCDLFEGGCHIEGCTGKMSVVSKLVEAGVVQLFWRCSMKHTGVWESSSVLGTRGNQKVYSSTVLMSSAVTATGNNFDKILLMMKFLNLNFISKATFSHVQSLSLVPVVKELWCTVRGCLSDVLGRVLCYAVMGGMIHQDIVQSIVYIL